jgi:hypothetical protein
MEVLVAYGREHPQGAVPSVAVVEDLEVLDEGVVVGVPSSSRGGNKAGLAP